MRWPNSSVRLVAPPLILAAGALVGCTSTGPAGERPLAVIDALVHTSFDDAAFPASRVMFSKAELAAEMRRHHVVGAVAMNRPGDRPEDLSGLDVVSCAGVAAPRDVAAAAAGLAAKAYRCVTLFLGYTDRYAYDPAYEPVYRLAERYHVPVVLYFGGSNRKVTEPHTVERVARAHPAVTFVLARAADPRTIAQRERDDFLRKGVRVRYDSIAFDATLAAEVAAANPNVVLDGSGLLLGDLGHEESDRIETYLEKPVRELFAKVGPAKLMFATGWPVTPIGPYLEAFERAIPPRDWPAVFHDNAARVYGFAATATPR
jgi:predicted TIM-barrel fold metal-dependent hydrolase